MPAPTDSLLLRPTPTATRQVPQVVGEVTTRARLMDRLVDLLIQECVAEEYWPQAYHRALNVLESLPLPTIEFRLAARRHENARRYAASSEFGAAAFELRQLRSALS